MKYTVQNAPFPIKQLNWLYGFLVGGLMFLTFSLIRLTQRVKYIGKENLNSSPNHIYAFWHENLPLHFTTNLQMKKPQIWLQHPMLFMKPIHVMVKMMGLTEMAYGSSGNKGKAALLTVAFPKFKCLRFTPLPFVSSVACNHNQHLLQAAS